MRNRWSKESVKTLILSALSAGIVVSAVWTCRHTVADGPAPITPGERASLVRLAGQLQRQTPPSARGGSSPSARLFAFDPNMADSLTLLKLGLESWQVGNIMKYRRKGGRWRSPEHFSRLYGLSRSEYERLRPYLRIAAADAAPRYGSWPERSGGEFSDTCARHRYQPVEKYAEGTVIALNSADTTQLKRIPGIGSWKARRIVDYRTRLGGYVSLAQLEELDDMPPGLSRWFTLDEVSPRTIRLNRASFKELVRHPYLSYEQTKVIVNHVRKYGPLSSWSDLRLYTEFSPADFERLAPYFRFD